LIIEARNFSKLNPVFPKDDEEGGEEERPELIDATFILYWI